jgi:hypothetical protein
MQRRSQGRASQGRAYVRTSASLGVNWSIHGGQVKMIRSSFKDKVVGWSTGHLVADSMHRLCTCASLALNKKICPVRACASVGQRTSCMNDNRMPDS